MSRSLPEHVRLARLYWRRVIADFIEERVKPLVVFTLVAAVASTTFLSLLAPSTAGVQNAYRWRNDDGSETTATYAAAENTPLTIDPEDPKRLRFGVAGPVGEQIYSVTDTITTGGGPNHAAFTPDGDYAYVTSYSNGNVYVVEAATHDVVDTISVGGQPGGAVVSPDGDFVYVTNFGDDNIDVIQTSDNTIIDTIAVGPIPLHPAISPDGAYVYIPDANVGTDGRVRVLRTSDNTIVANLDAGSFAFEAAVANGHVYVANQSENSVTVIEIATNTVVDTITTTGNPYGIIATSDGNHVYTGNQGIQSIDKIQTSDNTVVDSTSLSFGPFGVAINADDSVLYVGDWGGDQGVIFDAASLEIIKTLDVGNGPQFVAYSPDTGEAFFTNTDDGTISVVGLEDGTSGQLVHELVDTVSDGGIQDIAISSDGEFVYATGCDTSLSVIQTSDNTIADTVTVGSCAWGLDV